MPTTESEQRFADVLPNAIIALDNVGNFLWWNKAAKKLFTSLKNTQNITELLQPDYFNRYIVDPQEKVFEMELASKERIAISFVPYGEENYLLIAHDVTHVHHLEVMRQDFVANLSHELRTPLTVIHGYIETLMEEAIDHNKRQIIYTQMHQQSIRMERLVADLLLLSRLETEHPQEEKKRKVNVVAMIKTICHAANILSGKRQHCIHCNLDENLAIYGNEGELHSAFSNLIFNAVHYTPANGSIFVTWSYKENHPCFQVIDTGIGIAPEHIPRITERFYRVDKARSRASGGTGLGLAIVKHVLLRHHAHLKVTSTLGYGSCFMCFFPEESAVAE